MNNMLAAVRGNLYMTTTKLENGESPAENLSRVDMIIDQAAGMISKLLTFSRKDTPVMETFEVAPFINDVFMMAKTGASENILLRLDASPAESYIRGDANQLQQVMLNLLTNARDALR